MEVYDGDSLREPLLGKFCGNTKPRTITSSSDMLFVRFITDSSIERLGFSANYSTGINSLILQSKKQWCSQKILQGGGGGGWSSIFTKSPGAPPPPTTSLTLFSRGFHWLVRNEIPKSCRTHYKNTNMTNASWLLGC